MSIFQFLLFFSIFFVFIPLKSVNVRSVDSTQYHYKGKKPPVTIQDSKIPDPSELPPDGL